MTTLFIFFHFFIIYLNRSVIASTDFKSLTRPAIMLSKNKQWTFIMGSVLPDPPETVDQNRFFLYDKVPDSSPGRRH